MCSVNRTPGWLQPRAVFVALLAAGSILTCLHALADDAPLDLRKVPNADAKTAAEMKPYTDVIANTEVVFDMVPIPAASS